ncbi:DUF2339 domain-containing protein [Halalkalibacter urbisdiaboli]|uniref:DUF2339 domain-containing protein n=1 Tax=Halalkalibacter urbisdiaboli TaxID=1960589 RepID=UPI0013FD6025|nr:DUF2339 domain-containing protein [Halalkalibacter urbisdiaboli]
MSDEKYELLEKRVSQLEHEVQRLKQQNSKITVQASKSESFHHQTKPPTKKETKKIDWEKQIGQVWLPRIFLFVFLIGLIWGFKAVADYGLLNELARMLLAYVLAGAALCLGIKQMKANRSGFAQVLLGGAVVIFILATFAGNMLYGYIPSSLALILNFGWALLGIYLAHQYNSQPIALLAGVAGFLAPFLIRSDVGNVYLFVGYELFFYLILLMFSLRKSFRYLFIASVVLFHAAFVAFKMSPAADSTIVVTAIIIQHLTLFIAFIRLNVMKYQLAMLFTSFILTIMWVSIIHSDMYLSFLIAAILLYSSACIYFWRNNQEFLQVMFPILTIAMTFFFIELLDYKMVGIALLLVSCTSLFVGFKLKATLQKVIGTMVYLLSIFLIVFNGIQQLLSEETFAWVLLFVTVFFIKLLLQEHKKELEHSVNVNGLITGLLIVHGLFMLHFLMMVGTLFTESYSASITSLTVSFLWAIFAVTSIVYGVVKQRKPVRIFGIALIFLTLIKVIIADLPHVSMVIKAILFLGLGGIGVLLSRLFYTERK